MTLPQCIWGAIWVLNFANCPLTNFLSQIIHKGCLCSRHQPWFPNSFSPCLPLPLPHFSKQFCHTSSSDKEQILQFYQSVWVHETRGLNFNVNLKPSNIENFMWKWDLGIFSFWALELFASTKCSFFSNILHISSFKCICHCKTSGAELCKFTGIWHVQIWMFRERTFFSTKTAESVWRLGIGEGVWF